MLYFSGIREKLEKSEVRYDEEGDFYYREVPLVTLKKWSEEVYKSILKEAERRELVAYNKDGLTIYIAQYVTITEGEPSYRYDINVNDDYYFYSEPSDDYEAIRDNGSTFLDYLKGNPEVLYAQLTISWIRRGVEAPEGFPEIVKFIR
jgi:hypothetical protein